MTDSITIRYSNENSVALLTIIDEDIGYRFIFFLKLITKSNFCTLNEDGVYDCKTKSDFLKLEEVAIKTGVLSHANS